MLLEAMGIQSDCKGIRRHSPRGRAATPKILSSDSYVVQQFTHDFLLIWCSLATKAHCVPNCAITTRCVQRSTCVNRIPNCRPTKYTRPWQEVGCPRTSSCQTASANLRKRSWLLATIFNMVCLADLTSSRWLTLFNPPT